MAAVRSMAPLRTLKTAVRLRKRQHRRSVTIERTPPNQGPGCAAYGVTAPEREFQPMPPMADIDDCLLVCQMDPDCQFSTWDDVWKKCYTSKSYSVMDPYKPTFPPVLGITTAEECLNGLLRNKLH